ncbi:MAG: hypothetical protein H7288_05480 [Kineosporiaceae bacterium]|nr:hypothetical protein [Aeromicrobium sp.]
MESLFPFSLFDRPVTLARQANTSTELSAVSCPPLGDWPNGLDLTPPTGTAVKTFGLQECNVDHTGCSPIGRGVRAPAKRSDVNAAILDMDAANRITDGVEAQSIG